jgi:hypothetical protein
MHHGTPARPAPWRQAGANEGVYARTHCAAVHVLPSAIAALGGAHRIAVAPGCIFSANGKNFRNCLRISCGYPWSPRIEGAIKILGQLAR